ncbi:MAG: hypothetical protein LQ352_005220 [Teloschistes flavicans]|nr:MAG: hypothetical protein LQ352_005220 [Teloschistes flavicans]
MSSNRTRRIAKEIADIQSDNISNITATPAGNGDDLTHLKGSFKGPPGTPYEGGTYLIDVRIPNDYPFKPPIMRFDTKIWHPNVSSQTGAICLDTLSAAWSPVLTIKSALLSLQSLLSTPEPKDPQDAEVAGMLIRNPKEFDRVAQEWAIKYAKAPKREHGEGSGGTAPETKKEQERKSKAEEERERVAKYHGYNQNMIDGFVNMGFDLERVVSAFEFVGIDHNDGEEYTLEDAYAGDIIARLLGEP